MGASKHAPVVELVVTPDLGSGAERRRSSSLLGGTIADVEVGRDGAYLRTSV